MGGPGVDAVWSSGFFRTLITGLILSSTLAGGSYVFKGAPDRYTGTQAAAQVALNEQAHRSQQREIDRKLDQNSPEYRELRRKVYTHQEEAEMHKQVIRDNTRRIDFLENLVLRELQSHTEDEE